MRREYNGEQKTTGTGGYSYAPCHCDPAGPFGRGRPALRGLRRPGRRDRKKAVRRVARHLVDAGGGGAVRRPPLRNGAHPHRFQKAGGGLSRIPQAAGQNAFALSADLREGGMARAGRQHPAADPRRRPEARRYAADGASGRGPRRAEGMDLRALCRDREGRLRLGTRRHGLQKHALQRILRRGGAPARRLRPQGGSLALFVPQRGKLRRRQRAGRRVSEGARISDQYRAG